MAEPIYGLNTVNTPCLIHGMGQGLTICTYRGTLRKFSRHNTIYSVMETFLPWIPYIQLSSRFAYLSGSIHNCWHASPVIPRTSYIILYLPIQLFNNKYYWTLEASFFYFICLCNLWGLTDISMGASYTIMSIYVTLEVSYSNYCDSPRFSSEGEQGPLHFIRVGLLVQLGPAPFVV